MRFKFDLDELKDWGICEPSLDYVRQALRADREYRIDELYSDGLPRNDVFWYIFQVARRNHMVMKRVRQWVQECGVAVPDTADLTQCLSLLHTISAGEYLTLRKQGLSSTDAKNAVREAQFAKLLYRFID